MRNEASRRLHAFGHGRPWLNTCCHLAPASIAQHDLAWPLARSGPSTQKDNAFEVKADIPGVSKEDIQVSVDRDVLRINVEKKAEWKGLLLGVHRECSGWPGTCSAA
jgi:hypothetical protein